MKRQILGGLFAALLVIGCGPSPGPSLSGSAPPGPTPTPGGFSEAQAALALRGVTIHDAVSGDAGCPAVAGIHSNAARLEVSLAGDPARYEVFLFRWRRPSDFGAAEQSFSDCVDEYTAGIAGDVAIEGLELEPWRAYGPGWSEALLAVIEDALRDVGGGT